MLRGNNLSPGISLMAVNAKGEKGKKTKRKVKANEQAMQVNAAGIYFIARHQHGGCAF